MSFSKRIKIKDKVIGAEKVFIIAEIGSNHNQDIKQAYKMIDTAIECGVDAVKFQSIKGDELYLEEKLKTEERDLIKRIEFDESWHKKLINYCNDKKIIFFSAPTYLTAIDILIENDIDLIKIASPQTYGFPELIKKVGESGITTIMSTGYCKEYEIERAVNMFKSTGNKDLILLHCVSEYPTKLENTSIGFIHALKDMFNTIVGYSDHTLGKEAVIAAVSSGAKVIEKHITLDKNMEGPDHFFAMEPKEFKEMVDDIRRLEISLAQTKKDKITDFEINFREEIDMKMFFNKDLLKGHFIEKSDVKYLRSKDPGISSWEGPKIIGKKLICNVKEDEIISYKNLEK